MYEERIRTCYSGPAGNQDTIKKILKNMNIPGYLAQVQESSHDTGYPGLMTRATIVHLNLESDLEKKVGAVLRALNFDEVK